MSIAIPQSLLKLQFPISFMVVLVALFGIYYLLPANFIDETFVRFFAVVPGGFILEWLTPAHTVTTEHTRIISPLARLNVLKGCEGTEALFILYAGIIGAFRSFRKTVWGLVIGTALIFILNQIRIIALFFIAAYNKSLFESVHGFIAPVLIIALSVTFFIYWLNWVSSSEVAP